MALLLAVVLTWPLAARLGSAGRVDSGDGRHGIWNVAWVAHALSTDPASLFDANIFHPHRGTLAYSEANIVAGLVALPVWIATKNPYAAYNFVVLLAFAASALSAFLLVRILGGSRTGAAVAGLIYGFSPYMFAHIPHIQLLMTFGPALSMAAMHHFTKAPSIRRGLLLGAALALTGLACAYYGIFAGLATGLGLLWHLIRGRQFRNPQFWTGAVAAAVVVLVVVGPFFVPYLSVRDAGFERSLDEARRLSTNASSFFASAVVVHRWMLPIIAEWGQWREVLFPGFLAFILAGVALTQAARSRPGISRDTVGQYLAIGMFSFWASLGPAAGLYTVLYHSVPAFSFLRAPVRFGVLVLLVIAVLGGLAVSRFKATGVSILLVLLALVESYVGPLQLPDAPPLSAAHQRLAVLPRAPVAEFPFFAGSFDRHRHTEYMVASTFHWQPLINGYSDHMPADFYEALPRLQSFPSADALEWLRSKAVRWVVVHFDIYEENAPALRAQLQGMPDQLRLAVDGTVALYEVIYR